MKNVPLLVLAVVVVVLGLLVYKKCPEGPGFIGKAGAKHQHKDHKGNTVITEECETLVGQNSDVCIIPISYLQSMTTSPGGDEYAIEIHHKEAIIWFGEHGESITVEQMSGIDCSKHGDKDEPPSGSDPLLVDITQVKPNLVYAHVTGNPKNEGFCYKTNVNVTVDGKTTRIDPHEFLTQ